MAPTKTQILQALLGMSTVYAQKSSDTIFQCIQTPSKTFIMGSDNANAKLQAQLVSENVQPNFMMGHCCDTFDGSDECFEDLCLPGQAFCLTGKRASDATTGNYISNRFLIPFMYPSNFDNCPGSTDQNVELTTSGNQIIKKHDFQGTLPNANAEYWSCKWKFSSAPSLVPKDIGTTTLADRDASNGYLKVEVVSSGFDKNAIVIMQPPEGFYEYNPRSLTNNPLKQTFVSRSNTGRKYLIPAEYDVFVNVSPYSYNTGSQGQPINNGYVQIGVTHLTTKPTDIDESWTVVNRLEALDGTVPEVEVAPIDDDATDVEQLAAVDDTVLPVKKKNLQGEEISEGWGQETAFTIGETEVTKEQAAAASGVVVALIVIVVLLCCFFSYIERKKIAEEGRRLSTAVRRASTRLRRGTNADTDDKEVNDKDIENAKKAAGNKQEKNFLQDKLEAQRDANASRTSEQDVPNSNPNAKVNQSIEGLPKEDYKDPIE